MKRKTVLLIGGFGLVLTGLYFAFRKKPNTVVGSLISSVKNKISPSYNLPTTTGTTTGTTTSTTTKPVTSTTTVSSASFPLKYGSRGPEVKTIQGIMNNLYLDVIGTELVEDGIWGPKTEAAVKKVLGAGRVTLDDYNKLVKANQANVALNKQTTFDSIFS